MSEIVNCEFCKKQFNGMFVWVNYLTHKIIYHGDKVNE